MDIQVPKPHLPSKTTTFGTDSSLPVWTKQRNSRLGSPIVKMTSQHLVASLHVSLFFLIIWGIKKPTPWTFGHSKTWVPAAKSNWESFPHLV